MEKSLLSISSKNNKEEQKDPKLAEIETNLNNLSFGNSSKSNDFYYNNKNNNINKSCVSMNDNRGFNDINLSTNINNNIKLNHSQINNFKNNLFSTNNSFNNVPFNSPFFNSSNEIPFFEDNMNNQNRIINQNCYQINIEKLNIHNQINNINQNYNINPVNDNNMTERSVKSNDSHKDKDLNSNKLNQNMNLNYLLNNVEKLTENQSGCRLLQNKLQQYPFYSNSLYQALKNKLNLKRLSTDSFGNYLIQKLLEYLPDEMIQDFFNSVIYPSFMEIALNPHGSRVIQKLLGRIYVSQDMMTKFNQCLQNSMLEIFLNQCSTYIIITYISYIKYPNNQLIYSFIVKNIYYIATHKHSCCTLQKCLEEGNNIQRQEILMSLAYISNQLFNDQFGNYAIQFALTLKNEAANQIIISQYLNNFQNNISNRISSNVYEKVLEYCDFQTRQNIIKNLCNFETVKNLLYNSYGNYVLQKTILAANEPYRSMYIKYIAPLIDGLKTLPNGYIIIHKILNQFPELQGYSQNNSNKNKNYNINNNMNNNMKNFNINNNINHKRNGKKTKNDQNNIKNNNNFQNPKEE